MSCHDDPKCIYSRCIRQTINKIYKQEGWKEKYKVWYGDSQDIHGDYSILLLRSKFCLALPGDGWSARFEDAVLHGCIPVIIMDNTQVPFESILDLQSFAVRILQKDIPRIVDIITAIPESKAEEMRANVHKVWHRFRYMGLNMIDLQVKTSIEENVMKAGGIQRNHSGMEFANTRVDDAFSTIMQWLHWRIPFTRGEPRPGEKLFIPKL
ncbi:hypothetical protein CEUSTIGMA_g3226.t1 [Chlamydomonas eustigma]|uniref:Exostosin GT47 domain-containing protein n=1 Tax=Chlamydomonas eustigma TaxID=1157962 RepID=A0A250WY62_9CHLO|nr:hypothetical protein CEUSTIGMA_g3226.t1 [Chlamydomonas eustigma]|eukprot:GAX75783.1 hypothetical protein CEUSTIGMA_g3226.t1 [Chlamydomonas eustigma]